MDNRDIKKQLDTVYKEASIWEKEAEELDLTKVEKHTGKKIEIVDISDFASESLKMDLTNNYQWFFNQLKKDLKAEPSIQEYYCLYIKLVNNLTEKIIDNMFSISLEKLRGGYDDFYRHEIENAHEEELLNVTYAHEKEMLKLEFIFNESIENLKTTVDTTLFEKYFNDMAVKKKPEYITWLYEKKGCIDENNCVQISLPGIVEILCTEGIKLGLIENITPGLLRPLRKKNGESHSQYTLLKAIKDGKPKHLKKKSNKRHG